MVRMASTKTRPVPKKRISWESRCVGLAYLAPDVYIATLEYSVGKLRCRHITRQDALRVALRLPSSRVPPELWRPAQFTDSAAEAGFQAFIKRRPLGVQVDPGHPSQDHDEGYARAAFWAGYEAGMEAERNGGED